MPTGNRGDERHFVEKREVADVQPQKPHEAVDDQRLGKQRAPMAWTEGMGHRGTGGEGGELKVWLKAVKN